MIALLPDSRTFHRVHPRPRFRDWPGRSAATQEELLEVVSPVVELLIDGLESDAESYTDLIDRIGDLSSVQRSRLAEKLMVLARSEVTTEARQLVFEKLREEIARHQEYSDILHGR